MAHILVLRDLKVDQWIVYAEPSVKHWISRIRTHELGSGCKSQELISVFTIISVKLSVSSCKG